MGNVVIGTEKLIFTSYKGVQGFTFLPISINIVTGCIHTLTHLFTHYNVATHVNLLVEK